MKLTPDQQYRVENARLNCRRELLIASSENISTVQKACEITDDHECDCAVTQAHNCYERDVETILMRLRKALNAIIPT